MKQKLIKLSDTHYIVVDDSEIKEEDYKSYFFHPKEGIVFIDYIKGQSCLCNEKMIDFFKGSLQKITHSTHCLKCGSYDFNSIGDFNNTSYQCNDCDNKWKNIKPLSLSEVEEAIYGYDLTNLSIKATKEQKFANGLHEEVVAQIYYRRGFNAHKELVKDKLFTIEDIINVIRMARECDYDELGVDFDRQEEQIIQSLLPKTEWEVEFDEQGKLKLI